MRPIYQDEKSRQKALYRKCGEFVDKHKIRTVEDIMQLKIVDELPTLLHEICDIIGYCNDK